MLAGGAGIIAAVPHRNELPHVVLQSESPGRRPEGVMRSGGLGTFSRWELAHCGNDCGLRWNSRGQFAERQPK